MARFCPICGREAEKFVGTICADCYAKSHPLLRTPQHPVKVRVCKFCGSYLCGGRWVSVRVLDANAALQEAVSAVVARSVKPLVKDIKSITVGEFPESLIQYLNGTPFSVVVTVMGRASPVLDYYTEQYIVQVSIHLTACPQCVATRGRREAAIVQIRAEGRSLTLDEVKRLKKSIQDLLEVTNEAKSLIDIKENAGGIDVSLASKSAARAIVAGLQKEYPVTVKRTFKVVGRSRSGKACTRDTYRLLLPPFRENDIIEFKDEVFLVKYIKETKVHLLSLRTYRERRLGIDAIWKNAKIVKKDSIEEGIVISVVPPRVQVMTAPDYRVLEITMEKIPSWIKEGANVDIVKWRDKLFLSPRVE